MDSDWRAARIEPAPPTPWACGDCVLDPLVYPDTYCAPTPAVFHNHTTVLPAPARLQTLEPYDGVPHASFGTVLDALPSDAVIGVLGDSFMQQALDAMACDLRREGRQEAAGFLRWENVQKEAGRMREDKRMYRYNYAHSGGGAARRWFVLVQMYYNRDEVAKLLNASDVVLINYGLHYCQPARADADARCHEQFARHERELRELLAALQAFASRPGKRAVLQETSAQHFPQPPAASLATSAGGRRGSTGDWETRAFFPRIGPAPPERCRCEPTSGVAVPLRTQLLRNLSQAYPAVRVLPMHSLLQPRHAWHQQDCKVREQARAAGSARVADGCDCTHYCYSPTFWRVYFRSLLEQLAT